MGSRRTPRSSVPPKIRKKAVKTNNTLYFTLITIAISLFAYRYYLTNVTNSGPAYEIVNIVGKGKGVVATRDIAQGELIMKEEPLFSVQVGALFNTSVEDHLTKVLQSLNATQRDTFYELYKPSKARANTSNVEAIFHANSVIVGMGSGIIPTIARINHGCASAFNSVYHYRADEEVGVVHALKPIKKGEEIVREYLNTRLARQPRRQMLKEIYSFECGCHVCSLSGRNNEISDMGLNAMSTIEAEFRKWRQDTTMDGAEAVRLAKRVWTIGEKVGYWAGRGRLAEDVTRVAAAHHDDKAVQQWAELAAEWYNYELGYDSIEANRVRQFISAPKKHPSWQEREDQLVGGPDMTLV
ncbi:hypothetical protein M422DRAFT_24744 [Sphaerobolus stellatus SS14]|nr:hypothetical protein M422DRAFT_24744 [Sphaerobolus stellatus SS14]